MSKYQALGMDLDWEDEEGVTISPLSCILISKGIDNDGDEVYAVMHTEGLTDVEALGMLNFGKLHCEDMVKATIYGAYRIPASQPPDEPYVTS